jgi:hypothetical protein
LDETTRRAHSGGNRECSERLLETLRGLQSDDPRQKDEIEHSLVTARMNDTVWGLRKHCEKKKRETVDRFWRKCNARVEWVDVLIPALDYNRALFEKHFHFEAGGRSIQKECEAVRRKRATPVHNRLGITNKR